MQPCFADPPWPDPFAHRSHPAAPIDGTPCDEQQPAERPHGELYAARGVRAAARLVARVLRRWLRLPRQTATVLGAVVAGLLVASWLR